MTKIETLQAALQEALGAKISHMKADLGRVTIECRAADYLEVMTTLRDHPKFRCQNAPPLQAITACNQGDGRE